MKKIVLMMLVAMVPFLTMAQKKAKKKKNVKTEINEGLNASYEFMVITGYQITTDVDKRIKGGLDQTPPPEIQLKMMMKSNSNVKIQFDFGGSKAKENSDLLNLSSSYRSMAAAVNGAANKGWEFISSDVILSGTTKIHYYYMRKNK